MQSHRPDIAADATSAATSSRVSGPTKRVTGSRVEDRWTRRDGTPSARSGKGMRYLARYVASDGREHTKAFRLKKPATAWLSEQSAAVVRGEWIDPARSSATVADVAAVWLEAKQSKKPSTLAGYRAVWKKHVEPQWGNVPLSGVDPLDVSAWLGQLSAGTADTSDKPLSSSSVRHAHQVLHQILGAAVKSGRLPMNPATGAEIPKLATAERVFLPSWEILRLAAAADWLAHTTDERMRRGKAADPITWDLRTHTAPVSTAGLVIRTLGQTGLRAGEAFALKVSKVNLAAARPELTIDSAVAEVDGRLVEGKPKGSRTRRVEIPRGLVADLAAHIAQKQPGDYVFTAADGGQIRRNNFSRRVLKPALTLAGLDPRIGLHSLRHSYASNLLAVGVGVRQVQEWLGHASAKITFDVYAHLIPSEANRSSALLDAATGGGAGTATQRQHTVTDDGDDVGGFTIDADGAIAYDDTLRQQLDTIAAKDKARAAESKAFADGEVQRERLARLEAELAELRAALGAERADTTDEIA